MATLWCSICGSSHAKSEDCPGDLRATGPERHGWRVAVETPRGIEAYGVLVAPSYDLWRARILTYPKILWTIPGGSSTLKFVGASARDVEAQAIAFIQGHMRARGYKPRSVPDTVRPGGVPAEARPGVKAPGPELRKIRSLPVRFGSGPTLFSAMTVNVSASGLFVNTLVPMDPGLGVRVFMSLDVGAFGMRGEVVWNRRRPMLGRPAGMGVRLIAPPHGYVDFVRETI